MTGIEERAEAVLERVPSWIWDGRTLPVPVDHIADSCFSLLVREMDDLRAAPGVPDLPADQSLSGLLLPGLGEIWVNATEARLPTPSEGCARCWSPSTTGWSRRDCGPTTPRGRRVRHAAARHTSTA